MDNQKDPEKFPKVLKDQFKVSINFRINKIHIRQTSNTQILLASLLVNAAKGINLFLRCFHPRSSSSDSDSDMGGMYRTMARLLLPEHLRRVSSSSPGGNSIKAASIFNSEVYSTLDGGGEPIASDRPSGCSEGPGRKDPVVPVNRDFIDMHREGQEHQTVKTKDRPMRVEGLGVVGVVAGNMAFTASTSSSQHDRAVPRGIQLEAESHVDPRDISLQNSAEVADFSTSTVSAPSNTWKFTLRRVNLLLARRPS
eukprot:g45385.t1